jgi:3-mercaptopyruvate sulfurtransferase SseA
LYLDIDNLRDMTTEVPFMLPDVKLFSDKMKILDVKLTDTIVCYDTNDLQ